MIRFEHVSLTFPDKTIFDDFNYAIEKGENVSISGGSGRGKSSLLRLLQGYLVPDTGKILIDNTVISPKTIPHVRQKMAWIPQNINLLVNSGKELMNLMEVSERKDDISVLLERLGLESDILKKDFSKISGGQKQRIVISIVLSLKKSIIIMDEPTSSLDDKSIQLLMDVVGNIKDATIVSASHNQAWLQNSDKVLAL